MALMAMAVFSSVENKKDDCLDKTLQSLFNTVNFDKHTLMLSVNGYTTDTLDIIHSYERLGVISETIFNNRNLGTAEAVNLVWKNRKPNEHCLKMDDDVTTNYVGWLDEMEAVLERDNTIGQVGLKRKDLIESPFRSDWYKSELEMLPHEAGQRWLIVEKANHIMGTCVLHSSLLLDKIGYMYQMEGNCYGFDDVLSSLRSKLSGFKNVFLPHIEIEHIDNLQTDYSKWKQDNAMAMFGKYEETKLKYETGILSTYYNPFDKI